MYGFKAIKDFNESCNNTNSVMTKKNMQLMIKHIMSAQHYHMGADNIIEMTDKAIARDPDATAFMGNFAIDVKLPYDLCWFDFQNKKTFHGPDGKQANVNIGMIAANSDPNHEQFDSDVIQVMPCFCSYETGISSITKKQFAFRGKWILSGHTYFIKTGSYFTKQEAYTINEEMINTYPGSKEKKLDTLLSLRSRMGDKSNIITFPTIDLGKGWENNQIFLDSAGQRLSDQAVIALNVFLIILNCQNVITETINPVRIVKEHKKPDKKQYRYKVLKFKLPKSRKKYIGSTKTNKVMPLHLCAGHWKTYTEDAPLFGKIVGRWWWTSYVRGSIDNGIVDKNYVAVS